MKLNCQPLKAKQAVAHNQVAFKAKANKPKVANKPVVAHAGKFHAIG